MSRVYVPIAAALLVAMPAATRASDAEANAVYERMVASYAALDPVALETVYAADATYLSRNGKLDIHKRDRVMQGMRSFHEQLRVDGGKMEIKVRIVERKRFGDVYVDNGYVRSTYTPGKAQPARTTTGKFVTVLAKQPSGRWAFVTDADSDAPADAFDKASPVAGLKFDH